MNYNIGGSVIFSISDLRIQEARKMPNEEKPIEKKLRATFGSKAMTDEYEKFEAASTVAKRANTSETNKPVRWSTADGRPIIMPNLRTVFLCGQFVSRLKLKRI